MALLNCNFFSEALGLSMEMTVILPQETRGQIGMSGNRAARTPVLYLLHGLSDNHGIWLRRTSIERYVAPLGLAVIMPAVHRSFYSNMACGGRYWDFISEELPALVKQFFNLSPKREETFVAGLSMGGYGALKLALRQPERFAAAASLSGVTDIVRYAADSNLPDLKWIFGERQLAGSEHDLFHLATELVNSNVSRPAIYQCCGTEDFLLQDNRKFSRHLQQLGLDAVYQEAPGSHSWDFWDNHIQTILKWLPLTTN